MAGELREGDIIDATLPALLSAGETPLGRL